MAACDRGGPARERFLQVARSKALGAWDLGDRKQNRGVQGFRRRRLPARMFDLALVRRSACHRDRLPARQPAQESERDDRDAHGNLDGFGPACGEGRGGPADCGSGVPRPTRTCRNGVGHLDQLHRQRAREQQRARRLRERRHDLRGDRRRRERVGQRWLELDQLHHGQWAREQQRARRLRERQHDLRGDRRRSERVDQRWHELDQLHHDERAREQRRARRLRERQHDLRGDRRRRERVDQRWHELDQLHHGATGSGATPWPASTRAAARSTRRPSAAA